MKKTKSKESPRSKLGLNAESIRMLSSTVRKLVVGGMMDGCDMGTPSIDEFTKG
jgi:hypothetical protein